MTDTEKLDLILSELSSIKNIMVTKEELQTVKREFVGVNLHLENITDKNISILAENHLTLIDKLNQAIKVSDRNSMYEVQVNLLTSKIDKLEKEIAEIKNKIA